MTSAGRFALPATAAAAFVTVPATDDTAVPAVEATLLVTGRADGVAQGVAETAGHVGDARDARTCRWSLPEVPEVVDVPGRGRARVDRAGGRGAVVPPTPAGQAAAPSVTPELVGVAAAAAGDCCPTSCCPTSCWTSRRRVVVVRAARARRAVVVVVGVVLGVAAGAAPDAAGPVSLSSSMLPEPEAPVVGVPSRRVAGGRRRGGRGGRPRRSVSPWMSSPWSRARRSRRTWTRCPTRMPAEPGSCPSSATGPMNTPSTPSWRSGLQLSGRCGLLGGDLRAGDGVDGAGRGRDATPCGRKRRRLTSTATASGRQASCPNMSGGPPDDPCDRPRVDCDACSTRWCWSRHVAGRPEARGPRPLKLGGGGRGVTPAAVPGPPATVRGGRAGRSVGAHLKMFHIGSVPVGVSRKERIARSWRGDLDCTP